MTRKSLQEHLEEFQLVKQFFPAIFQFGKFIGTLRGGLLVWGNPDVKLTGGLDDNKNKWTSSFILTPKRGKQRMYNLR